MKTIQVRDNYAPHLTENTKELQKKRNSAQAEAAKSGKPEDWRYYRSLRNQCLSSLWKDRKDWEKQRLNSTVNKPTEIWKTVKQILNWNNSGPPNQLLHEGKIINSPAGLATTLNSFFINKVKKLVKGIPRTDSDPLFKLKDRMKNRNCSFKLREITQEEGLKLIKSAKDSTATGVDFIDNKNGCRRYSSSNNKNY